MTIRRAYTEIDFRCQVCHRLIRQGAEVIDVDGELYCDLDCARTHGLTEGEDH